MDAKFCGAGSVVSSFATTGGKIVRLQEPTVIDAGSPYWILKVSPNWRLVDYCTNSWETRPQIPAKNIRHPSSVKRHLTRFFNLGLWPFLMWRPNNKNKNASQKGYPCFFVSCNTHIQCRSAWYATFCKENFLAIRSKFRHCMCALILVDLTHRIWSHCPKQIPKSTLSSNMNSRDKEMACN